MIVTCRSMEPLPSTSYMRNAHWSFSFGVPAEVTSIAQRNSCPITQMSPCARLSPLLLFNFQLFSWADWRRSISRPAEAPPSRQRKRKRRSFSGTAQSIDHHRLVCGREARKQTRPGPSDAERTQYRGVRHSRNTYFKVNKSVLVSIERAEDVIAELFGVPVRKEHFVHVDEFGRRESPARTVLLQNAFIQ